MKKSGIPGLVKKEQLQISNRSAGSFHVGARRAERPPPPAPPAGQPGPSISSEGQTEGKGKSSARPGLLRKGHVWGPWGKSISPARGLGSVMTPSFLLT